MTVYLLPPRPAKCTNSIHMLTCFACLHSQFNWKTFYEPMKIWRYSWFGFNFRWTQITFHGSFCTVFLILLPTGAKIAFKCQVKSWQYINETNKHQDQPMISLSNLTAQIESQKLTNQIESLSSTCWTESLNCRITPQKTPKLWFKSQSRSGFAHHC